MLGLGVGDTAGAGQYIVLSHRHMFGVMYAGQRLIAIVGHSVLFPLPLSSPLSPIGKNMFQINRNKFRECSNQTQCMCTTLVEFKVVSFFYCSFTIIHYCRCKLLLNTILVFELAYFYIAIAIDLLFVFLSTIKSHSRDVTENISSNFSHLFLL